MESNDRISNTSWAYATADQLWEGETVYTAQEMQERQQAEAEAEMELAIARRYGDCGRSIVGTGDYDQLLAEEAANLYFTGFPAPPLTSY